MTFNKWLKSKWREDSAAGDLARDARQDPEWPSHGRTYKCFKDHLFNMNACSRAEDALLQAWRRWEAEELPPKAPHEKAGMKNTMQKGRAMIDFDKVNNNYKTTK